MAILQKVEKLICHEVSARKLGSIAEADAFAAKARQLLSQHRVERIGTTRRGSEHGEVDSQAVTAQQAGISPARNRQEWSERLASAVAAAFHCTLMIQSGSNTVVFRGQGRDRATAAQLYSELAKQASIACMEEFTEWKGRRRPAQGAVSLSSQSSSAAYSRRWKQSFLLGFARTICQRFVCDHNCLQSCQHAAGLVKIGRPRACRSDAPRARAIGGIDLLYDAVYRGQARAADIVLDVEQRFAA